MLFQRIRRCKTVTFDNFCAISLTTPLEHHSAIQFLKAATNLNVVQPKLFQASRQDDHRFSDCTVSVIQILDDADAAFPHLGRGSADRSIRDHHVRRQTAQPLTILPPVAALAVGLPAQRAIAQRFSALTRRRHRCPQIGPSASREAEGALEAFAEVCHRMRRPRTTGTAPYPRISLNAEE